MRGRLAHFRELMVEYKLSAFYLSSHPNRRYLSGFTGTHASLFITARRAVLFTDFRYVEQAREQSRQFTVRTFPKDGRELPPDLVARRGVPKIGIEAHQVSLAHYKRLARELRPAKLVSAEYLVEQLRREKDRDEIRALRKSIAIGDSAFLYARRLIRRMLGRHRVISERAVAWEMEKFARTAGAEKLAFDCIVASDKNASRPHHPTGNSRLKRNSFVIIDFGVVVDGYHSDMTRTFYLGARPSRRQRAIYEAVLKAQERALGAIRAGTSASAIDRLARNYIMRAGFGAAFGHGLGHGVGLEVHEAPTLSPHSKDVLQCNDVVSIEPGIYISGWGGVRIEDLVRVENNGAELLSKAPKGLREMCMRV